MNYCIETIARTIYEANKAFAEECGDFGRPHWEEASEEKKRVSRDAVIYTLRNPLATPEDQHDVWSKSKIDQGYVFGYKKSEVKKTHPCLIPYGDLPEFQKLKDKLVRNIILTFI